MYSTMAVVCMNIITGEQGAYKKILPEGSRRGGKLSGRKGNKAFDYTSNHCHTLAEWMGDCVGLFVDVAVDARLISKRASICLEVRY